MKSAGAVLDDSKPLWRTMIVFLVPLMLSNVLQAASSTASAAYLGRLISVKALAAVAGLFPIQFFLIAFLVGLSSGSTVLIGQAWGARNPERVREIAGTTVTATLVLGIAVALLGLVISGPLVALIGTPADVAADAERYLRVVLFIMPLAFVYLAYSTFLRGVGDAQSPFISLIATTIISIALGPVCIRGGFGLPAFGLVGPVVSNTIATSIGLFGLLVYLFRSNSTLKPDRAFARHLRIDLPTLLMIVRIGIPTGLQLVLISMAEIAVISFVNHFGSSATAAYGAVNQIVSYVQFPAISIGITASIFGAQAIGAGRLDRLGAIARSAVLLNYTIEGLLIALAYLFARPMIRLFIADENVVTVAHDLLMITLWSYVIFGNSSVLSGLMRSSGSVLWPTLIGVGAIWLVEVPVAWVLSHGSLGLRGVWIAYPIAYVTSLIGQITYYTFVWKRRPITALVTREGPAAT